VRTPTKTFAIIVSLVIATAGTALGAGFEVAEVAGRQLGNAYAGKAAEADDASTVFFNPAGLMRLKTYQMVAAMHGVIPTAEFNDDGSTGALGGALGGDDGGDPGALLPVPSFYVAAPVCDWFAIGLGVNAPFGLKTEYDDGWQGRYHAIESRLMTINLNPCVAIRLNEALSFGAGLSYQYADATLSQEIDFGTIGFSQLGPATAAKLGLSPEGNDGFAEVEGDDWSWGWNVGLLLEIDEDSRVGIAYRSKISHTLEGDADFDVPSSAGILTTSGAFTDVDASARVTLPEQLYLSGYHRIHDDIALVGDITWTNWERFDELRIKYDNPQQPDSVTPENWDAAFRFSLGAIIDVCDGWTVRVGGAYDQSPIPNEFRTARIPTDDRYWLTAGVTWQVLETLAVDLSYMHVFIGDADVDETSTTGQRLKGEYEGSAEVVAVQVVWDF
jgi:long-chain fatty acid transport protein